jgi:hypothetical protein
VADRIHCPFCDSPDTAPYDYGTTLPGAVFKQWYPRAGRCMDCEQTFYDHERQSVRNRIDFAKLKKAEDDGLPLFAPIRYEPKDES